MAYALPRRRFADVLTDANARLGANADAYAFAVTDLHHLFLAGLPAHRVITAPEPSKSTRTIKAIERLREQAKRRIKT